MAVAVRDFPWPLTDGGITYHARSCGTMREDGLWVGWIEFDPSDGSPTLRSERETTQPNLTDLEYWSSGLSEVYLEGVLERTLHPVAISKAAPRYAILDPYSVYAKSPQILMQELRALRSRHLRQIVRAYALADPRTLNLEDMSEPELAALIVQRVSETASPG